MVGPEPTLKAGDRILYNGIRHEVIRVTMQSAVIKPLEGTNRREVYISAFSEVKHVQ